MNEILNTLWRTTILLLAACLQAFGAIFQGIAIVFGWCGKILREFSSKLLEELDKGKYAEKIEEIAKTGET